MFECLVWSLLLGSPATLNTPQASTAALALLERAETHRAAGRSFDARVMLGQVVEQYPLTPEAIVAAKSIAKLGVSLQPSPPQKNPDGEDTEQQARRLLEADLPKAAQALLGGTTRDLELALALVTALAESDTPLTPTKSTLATTAPSLPPSALAAQLRQQLRRAAETEYRAQQVFRRQSLRGSRQLDSKF